MAKSDFFFDFSPYYRHFFGNQGKLTIDDFFLINL